jgi:signal transduction histidine kinase
MLRAVLVAYARTVNVRGFVLRLKGRWVERGLPDYPIWIAAVIDAAAVATATVVVGQRGLDAMPTTLALALLALLPWALEMWGRGPTWLYFVVLTGGSVVALSALHTLEYDFAPFLLVLMVGHVAGCTGVRRALLVLVAGVGVLAGLTVGDVLPGSATAIWVAGMVLALDIGFVIRSQQLRIEAQVREHATRERQAVLEERQRIAREVHDVVAHSLSVTMLHLTAARRDLEDGGDLTEAVDALREAERVGRQAVADVRRTVGLLGDGDAIEPPAPTAQDIEALVADFRGAGLEVALVVAGDLSEVPPSTGLGLYRVVQESLTNVARHCPGAPASVSLDLRSDPGQLVVRNPVPDGATRGTGGSGLTGMAERAELLGASLSSGRQGGDWVVSVVLPRGDTGRDAGGHTCPLPRLARGLRSGVGTPVEST